MFTQSNEKASDYGSTGGKIEKSGMYLGKFTRAELKTNDKGTKSLNLTFETDNSEYCYINLYTHNNKGEELPAYDTVNALMTVLGIPNMQPVQIQWQAYDKESNKEVTKTGQGFAELMHKDVGLLLRKELSEYLGKEYENMTIFSMFNVGKNLTPAEIAKGETLPQMLEEQNEWLLKNPVRDRRNGQSDPNAMAREAGNDDFDSDVPF